MPLGRFNALDASGLVVGTLLAGFRTQPIVTHDRGYYGWHRRMWRQQWVRDAPGQVPMVERSIFQPINLPPKQQVDIVDEYMPPWPFSGAIGYRERIPYTQGAEGQSTMTTRPQYPYTVQPPRFSTLPQIFGVGGG